MNILRSSSIRASLIAAVSLLAAALGSAQTPTPDWYLVSSMATAGDNHWNMVNGPDSNPAAFRFWANGPTVTDYVGHPTTDPDPRYAIAMDPNAVYFVAAGKELRTVGITSGTDTFGGGTLILGGAGANLLHRGNATSVAVVENLVAQNGSGLRSAIAAIQNLNITNFVAESGTVTFNSQAGRGFNLSITSLTGAADIVFTNAGTYNLNIANTAGFAGDILLTGAATKLGFLADLSFDGALILDAGNTVNLTHSVSVSALTIAGDTLGAGIYSYTWLNENYADIFTAGSVDDGMISVGSTIPEPSAFAVLAGLGMLVFAGLRRRRP